MRQDRASSEEVRRSVPGRGGHARGNQPLLLAPGCSCGMAPGDQERGCAGEKRADEGMSKEREERRGEGHVELVLTLFVRGLSCHRLTFCCPMTWPSH